MKIMLMTDLEGVAGVLNAEDWIFAGGRYHSKGIRLLTEEVNAAVDGLLEGGATDVIVADAHGGGAIDPELLDERAQLQRGRTDPIWPGILDSSFDGLGFVGQHARAGTPYSHLTHTQTFKSAGLEINGISIGEYGQLALCAMELGVPTILACGEKALTQEAAALTPGVVAVAVKRGLLPDGLDELSAEDYAAAKLSAIHLSPGRARALIRQAALEAITKLKSDPPPFRYPELSPPYVRVARIRRDEGGRPHTARDEHPSSIIALMNLPATLVD